MKDYVFMVTLNPGIWNTLDFFTFFPRQLVSQSVKYMTNIQTTEILSAQYVEIVSDYIKASLWIQRFIYDFPLLLGK